VVVGAGAVLVWCERRFPYNPGQPLLRTGFWNDLVLYCLVQSYVLGVVIGRIVGYVDGRTGWSLEFAPLVLLGATPTVIVVKGAVSAIWGMFIHSNIDVRLGRAQYVVNGPEMHRWHHATDAEAHGKNFSTKFAFWDWLFGTAYFPDRTTTRAQRYGITEREYREDFPVGYLAQHAYPFLGDRQPVVAGDSGPSR
jgi:hypothetical protein